MTDLAEWLDLRPSSDERLPEAKLLRSLSISMMDGHQTQSLIDHFKLRTEFGPSTTVHRIPTSRRTYRREEWTRIEELGYGSFGIVYLEKENSGKLRAVKEIRKLKRGVEAILWLREILALASFSQHDANFVRFHGWYENTTLDQISMAMEYFEHGDLQKCVSGSLPESEGKLIIHQLAEALNFMHREDFTHRDLKPANVFVVQKSPHWAVKLADFSVSKRVRGNNTTLHTVLVGDFVAPEIFDPLDDDVEGYTNAVDLWSLGCVAHWLLTASAPFPARRGLSGYYSGRTVFPSKLLAESETSRQGISFIRKTMAVMPDDRITAWQALQDPWLHNFSKQTSPLNKSVSHSSAFDDEALGSENFSLSDSDTPEIYETSEGQDILSGQQVGGLFSTVDKLSQVCEGTELDDGVLVPGTGTDDVIGCQYYSASPFEIFKKTGTSEMAGQPLQQANDCQGISHHKSTVAAARTKIFRQRQEEEATALREQEALADARKVKSQGYSAKKRNPLDIKAFLGPLYQGTTEWGKPPKTLDFPRPRVNNSVAASGGKRAKSTSPAPSKFLDIPRLSLSTHLTVEDKPVSEQAGVIQTATDVEPSSPLSRKLSRKAGRSKPTDLVEVKALPNIGNGSSFLFPESTRFGSEGQPSN